MVNKITPTMGRRSTTAERGDALPLLAEWKFGIVGTVYPRNHPARQAELNQLKIMAKDMMAAWIGDMLGAEKKGEMIARLK
jgi:hypothetical protein